MGHSIPHIVIVEREFLIAYDAEYLIKAALECRTTLLRPEQLDQWDAAALADIDLCLLEVPFDATESIARIERLVEARVPLLLTSLSDIHPGGVDGFEIIPVLRKPYEEGALAAAVKERVRRP